MQYRKICLACLLGLGLVAAMTGCEADDDTSSTSSSTAETSQATATGLTRVTSSQVPFTLSYDADTLPEGLAEVAGLYFHAIDIQDFDLYSAQINATYWDAMEAYLQETYGYGIDNDFAGYREALVSYAGTEDYTITAMELTLAEEALAEQYESGTDFVGNYLEAYGAVLGDDFVTTLQDESNAIYDVALTILGEDADGGAITILDRMELLVVEASDGTFGILG